MPTDFGWQLPDDVWALGPEIRQACLEWSTDVCQNEGRWYLRGILGLPFKFMEGRWGWGCWAEVTEEAVQTLWQIDRASDAMLPPAPGVLACDIPCYPHAKGLPLLVHFGPVELRPLFSLKADLDHPLAVDQMQGIDEEQYHAILHAVGA